MAIDELNDELNAKGVSIGGSKTRFELLAEDDTPTRNQPAQSRGSSSTPRSTAS
jgi:hypothetical protein